MLFNAVALKTMGTVAKSVDRLHFPMYKTEMIECAAGNHAPGHIIEVLERLPEKPYRDSDEILRAISECV